MHVFQAQQVWCLGGKQGVPPSVAFEFWYKQQHKGHEKGHSTDPLGYHG